MFIILKCISTNAFQCIKIVYNIEILPDFSSRIIKCDYYYNEIIFSVFSWKAMVFLK